MSKIKYFLVAMIFIANSAYADQGQVRMGVELGLSPVDLEAEDTAQKIANASGSTVTTEYSTGVLVGRIFADYSLTPEVSAEVGYFFTGSLDATYTISGASATESYDAMGVDAAAVIKSNDLFFKIGMHSSELNGAASLTIGGTKYNVSDSISGTGYLAGAGLEIDNSRFGFTYYSDMGGDSDSDMSFLYYGIIF